MKTKRIISAALSAAMALSLSVPAFASGGGTTPTKPNTETTITGKYEEAIISVDVPETGNAFINPYGLGTSVKDSNGADVQIKGQIVTAPLYIVNNSGLDLDVGASITPALGEKATMKLASTTTKGSGTEGQDDYVAPATAKSAYVIVQGVASSVITADGDATADTPQDAIKTAYATDATWAKAVSSAALTVSSTGTTKAVVVDKFATLKAATVDTDGTVTAHKSGSIMLYRLTGDCVKAPKEAWTADDTFTVKIAFSFSPAETVSP